MIKVDLDDIVIIDVADDEEFPVILRRENNWKLFHPCNVILCNIAIYVTRHQSEKLITTVTFDLS